MPPRILEPSLHSLRTIPAMVALPITADTIIQPGDRVCITPKSIWAAAPEDYLSVPQICRDLRKSPAVVHGWIRNGELPAFNKNDNGRPRWMVRKLDLERFLEARIAAQQPVPRATRRRPRNDGDVIQFLT
jgi:hypothetical protein